LPGVIWMRSISSSVSSASHDTRSVIRARPWPSAP
jgi:hypothetical protein